MKRAAALLLASLIAAALAGCARTETPDSDELGSNDESAASFCGLAARFDASFNPILTDNKYNFDLGGLIYEGLIRLGEDYSVNNLLASSVRMEQDNAACRIVVAQGRRFSDGTPVTAADVAASLELARGEGSNYRGRLSAVAAIEIVNDSELVVTLSSPNALFPAMLDIPVLKSGSADAAPAGSGNYRLVLGESPRLEAVNDLTVREILLVDIEDNNRLCEAIENGEITFFYFTNADFGKITIRGSYEKRPVVTNELCYLGVVEGGALSDPELRRIFSSAIDRGQLIEDVMQSDGYVTTTATNPRWRYNKTPQISDFSASDLFRLGYEKDDDGYYVKDGARLTLRLGVDSEAYMLGDVCSAMRSLLEKNGVELTIVELSGVSAARASGCDAYISMIKLTPDMDVSSICSLLGRYNYGGAGSEQLDAAIAAYKNAPQERIADAAGDMISAIAEDMPVIPLYFNTSQLMYKKGISAAFTPTEFNPYAGIENGYTDEERQ